MDKRIESILASIETARRDWKAFVVLIEKFKIPLDRIYPELNDSTINELNARLIATFRLFEDNIKKNSDTDNQLLLPRFKLINASCENIQSNALSVVNSVNPYLVTHTGEGYADNLQIQFKDLNGRVSADFGLSTPLLAISNAQQTLFDQFVLGFKVLSNKGAGVYVRQALELEKIATKMSGLLNDSQKKNADILGHMQNASQVLEEINKKLEESKVAHAQVETTASNMQSAYALATDHQEKADKEIDKEVALIKEKVLATEDLSKSVVAYEAKFAAFQTSINDYIEAHSQFEIDRKEAHERNVEREEKIDELLKKSDAMIRGSTTAGLSKSLDDTRLAYEKRLSATGWWFLGAVVFLLICAFPIAGQLIPGPWQAWFAPIEGGNKDIWLVSFGKIVLIVPAIWATAFFAGNYAELFHLCREYAHKAALAKAVDGFKREAPNHEQEIVAAVFLEIQDNPGNRKRPDAAVPQTPFLKQLFDKILGAVKVKKDG